MDVALTNQGCAVVTSILENYLPALREEIYKTENFAWRTSLKQDEGLLKSVIACLKLPRGSVASKELQGGEG